MSNFWTLLDYLEARKPGNEDMLAMINCYSSGSKRIEDAPEEALALFQEGRARAEALNKDWWVLFFDHWTVQTHLFHTRDYNQAMALAVQATVDARQPALAECPTRVCIHEDLISVYMGRDPIGYAALIEDAIEYMAQEVKDKSSCYSCLKSRRINFDLAHGKVDEAHNEAMHYLSITENNKHYRIHALGSLCEIAFLNEDWLYLLEWAEEGEPLAREKERSNWIAVFMGWQVLALHKLGHEEKQAKVLDLLQAHTNSMRTITSGSYFDALCAYYESVGNVRKALTLREAQIATKAGKGQFYRECQTRIKHCELLIQLGEATDEAISALREVAQHLEKPDKILDEIEQLASTSA